MSDVLLKDQILLVKNLLTADQCDTLVNEYNNSKQKKTIDSYTHAFTDNVIQSTSQYIDLKPNTETFKIVHSATEILTNKWLTYLKQRNVAFCEFLKIHLKYAQHYRIVCFNTNEQLEPHIDSEDFTYATCILNLNDNFKGGEHSFFNGNYNITLKKGSGLIFPTGWYWVHEIKKITSGNKLCIPILITRHPKNLNKQIQTKFFLLQSDIKYNHHLFYKSSEKI